MDSGFVYLIHYPDGSGREPDVHHVIGPKCEVDDEIVPGWAVFKLETHEQTIHDQTVQYEAWVVPKADTEAMRAWSLAWLDIWRDNPTS